jgi:membrane-associated phospholipid phosphatase
MTPESRNLVILGWLRKHFILPPCRVFIGWPAVAIISGTMLALFTILAFYVSTNGILPIDVAVTRTVQIIKDETFFNFMFLISLLGTPVYVAGTLIVFATVALLLRRWLEAAFILASPVAELVDAILKIIVAKPRPTSAQAVVSVETLLPSFPSGHVVYYVFFYGLLAYLALPYLAHVTWRRVAIGVAVVLSIIVGVSRIYLGAHWFSDVLGGYFLGIGMVIIYIKFFDASAKRLAVGKCDYGEQAAGSED